MKKAIIPIFLVLTVFSPVLRAEQQLLDRVVAVVNDEIILQSELDTVLRPLYEELRAEYHGDTLYQKLAEIRLKLLNQLIEDRLVYQEALARKMQVDETEIEKGIREFETHFGGRAAMEKAMEEQGMTLRALRERVERKEMVQKLHDMEIRSKIVVSPLEIEAYFKDHPEEFSEKEKVRVLSLTIKKSDEAREQGLKDEEAWKIIQNLRAEIMKGRDFKEAASKFSEDRQDHKAGAGEWITRGDMIPAIDEVIFTMKNGETSEIIETSMGYHLFRLEEKKTGKTPTLEEARDAIYGVLFRKKYEERFKEWMEGLKRKAYISVR
ncbi:MAG: peptidylprolyl isomerase [Candidatus Omnitrophota bacterium]